MRVRHTAIGHVPGLGAVTSQGVCLGAAGEGRRGREENIEIEF